MYERYGGTLGMRPLLPTLRERKRYIVYQIITSSPLGKDMQSELLKKISETLGVFDSAGAGLLSVSYDKKSQTGVIRCNHRYVKRVRASLAMTTFLGRTRVCIRTLGVSGILDKTKRFLPGKQERQRLRGL